MAVFPNRVIVIIPREEHRVPFKGSRTYFQEYHLPPRLDVRQYGITELSQYLTTSLPSKAPSAAQVLATQRGYMRKAYIVVLCGKRNIK